MSRNQPNPTGQQRAPARIAWRDGPFVVECTSAGDAMCLTVYRGASVVAQERVASAEVAGRRSADICRRLNGGAAVGDRGPV